MSSTPLPLPLTIGFDALRANPLRALLSTLGVIMGVGSMVSVLSIGDGVEAIGREQLATTTDIQRVGIHPQTMQRIGGALVERSDVVSFGLEDLASLVVALPDSPRVVLARQGGGLVQLDGDSAKHSMIVTGSVPSVFGMRDLSVGAGSLFTNDDVASSRPVAVLSAMAADSVAGASKGALLVGRRILVKAHPFTVIGVLAAPTHDRPEIYIPFSASAAVMTGPNGGVLPSIMLLDARTVEQVKPMRARAEQWLGQRFGPAWKARIIVSSQAERLEQVSKAILIFKLLMGSITGVSLLVGGIGIMNVLLASVTERTREIGIRKAAGARNRDILAQFLAESVAIAGAGAGLGVLLGLGVAALAALIMRIQTQAQVHAAVTAGTIIFAVVASVTVGIGFGLYPALRAARLSPIDAIRHE
jgi:putative ABC transport system permease protein